MLPTKEIVLVVPVTLLKPSLIQKLDGMNKIMQLKFRTIKTPLKQYPPLFHMGYYFKCSKNVRTGKNLEVSYIALWKPDLNKPKGLWVLLRNGATFFFSSLIALDNEDLIKGKKVVPNIFI